MAYLPKNIILYNRNFDIIVKRHARSRRITMRIHPIYDQVRITAPKHLSEKRIADFLNYNQHHLAQHAAALPQPVTLQYGTSIPVFGEMHYITQHRKDAACLVILSTDAKVKQHTVATLGMLLKDFIQNVIDDLWHHPLFMHIERPVAITLRDPASRWGSCSSNGRIMLSRRLIFAPKYVARYVIIHECCHLIHMDHSNAFWTLCRKFSPECDKASAWLKHHHRELFKYQI